MHKKAPKRYWQMTSSELAAATKEFDGEFVPTQPLSESDKAAHRRARAKAAAAKRNGNIGKSRRPSRRVAVSIESGLLQRADAYARAHGTTRSQLVARGLSAIIGEA
jgi:hypothetical protein